MTHRGRADAEEKQKKKNGKKKKPKRKNYTDKEHRAHRPAASRLGSVGVAFFAPVSGEARPRRRCRAAPRPAKLRRIRSLLAGYLVGISVSLAAACFFSG